MAFREGTSRTSVWWYVRVVPRVRAREAMAVKGELGRGGGRRSRAWTGGMLVSGVSFYRDLYLGGREGGRGMERGEVPIAPASKRASAWTNPRPRAAPDTITTFPARLNSGRRETVPSVSFEGVGGGDVTVRRGFLDENWRVRGVVDVLRR